MRQRAPNITAVSLKITLRPGERILLGGALLTNGDQAAKFRIENEVPVLREKDLLSEEQADTVCKRIYFAIQLMYFDPANIASHHKTYWSEVRKLVEVAPSAIPLVDEIGEHIVKERFYQGLKVTRKLIDYEAGLTHK